MIGSEWTNGCYDLAITNFFYTRQFL
jgi:hypothetical protein